MAEHSCECLRLATWYLGEDQLCVVENGQWVFIHNSFRALDHLWDNPLNHSLHGLVQFCLFITLETIGLGNIMQFVHGGLYVHLRGWQSEENAVMCLVFSLCCPTRSSGASPPSGFTSAMLQNSMAIQLLGGVPTLPILLKNKTGLI